MKKRICDGFAEVSMKRFIALFLIAISIFLFVGCESDAPDLTPGFYYAVGEYEEFLTPYLCLETDKNQFSFGGGAALSYTENGSYKVSDEVIIATTQSTTFKFEIKDSKTLVLMEIEDYDLFNIPIGTQFVFSDSIK